MGDHVEMLLPKISPRQGKIADVTPRNLRLLRWVHRGSWATVVLADLGDITNLTPGIPGRIHALALAGCLALTIIATWARSQAPVRAAFLDGMLFERDNAATQLLPQLPAAVGQNVIPIKTGGLHRRPSPRQRDPR